MERGDRPEIIPYTSAFARKPGFRRLNCKVRLRGQSLCHLIIGRDLHHEHHVLREFYTACPSLTIRPLIFYHDADGTDYICVENFEGESLDKAVADRRMTSDEWLDHVRRAQEALAKTAIPSTSVEFAQEVSELIEKAAAYPGLTATDVRLLRDTVKPILLSGAPAKPYTRWSNRDFVGRNLLVNAAGELRLVDCEYAGRTHFGQVDWLRLMEFSRLPERLDPDSLREVIAAKRPWFRSYLWLHQFSLLRKAQANQTLEDHMTAAIRNLLSITVDHGSTTQKSLFIDRVLRQHIGTESLLLERTKWAKSLQFEVEKLEGIVTDHTQLLAERTTWAKSLEKDLSTAQAHFDKLSKEYAERTTWAKSLETELKKSQAALASQTTMRELAELQRDLAVRDSEANRAVASAVEATTQAEVANAEVRHLSRMVTEAQIHVDHLLDHARNLQSRSQNLESRITDLEAEIQDRDQKLQQLISELESTRDQLARYESVLICRLGARLLGVASKSTTAKPSHGL